MNAEFRLEGHSVLVTGGTRGIGRAISLRLARAGAAVVANYARDDRAAETLLAQGASEGLSIETLRADLTLQKSLTALQERMQQCAGRLVCLVHCAATGVHRPIDELTAKHWDWTMALNARAFFELVRALLPMMRAGSAVVALSSAGAVRAVPAYTAIGSSKGALESLARHLAFELAPRGVRVNILAPGTVETSAWDAFPGKDERLAEAARRSPLGRLVSVEEVACAAQFLLSPASQGIVGHRLVIDGGAGIVE